MIQDRRPPPRRGPGKTAALMAGVAGVVFGILAALYVKTEPPPGPILADVPGSETLRGEFPLRIWSTPRAFADFAFEDEGGRKVRLEDFRGKVVLVNLWATWCAPCRKEMPSLDRLQMRLGGSDFAVLAISIERGGAPKVGAFYSETGVTALSVYIDDQGEASGAVRSAAIPTSVLIDRDGKEIGRLLGPAEWDSAAAIDFLRIRIAGPKGK